jgi:5-aminolevulinate synthase
MALFSSTVSRATSAKHIAQSAEIAFHSRRSLYSSPKALGQLEPSILHNTSNLTVVASVSKYIIDIPTAPKEPQSSAKDPKTFAYEKFYESLLQRKKNDKSYRYFRNINRIAKDFPAAHSADERKRVKVWCSNDYVRYHSFSSDLTKLTEISLAWGGILL